MRTKFPIHTTLSAEAIKILERYEKELGAKNTVLEKALLAMGGKKSLGEESIYLNGKLKTGIVELDEMLFGGFLKGTIVEVTGPPGSGKSLLTALIVIKHIEKYEKQCAIISFDGIKETVEATNLLGMEMGKCIGDYFLDVIQGRSDIVDIYKLLKRMPSIIVFDDIRTLGYDSISSLMSSGEWRLMSNIIKEQDTVCIIVGNDGDDNTSSSCGTVIRMGRIAGTDGQLHNTIRIVKHIGESNSKLHVLDFKEKNVHIREIKLSKNSPLEDKKPVVQQEPVKTKVQNSERKPIIASGNNEPTKNLKSKDKRNHETAGTFQQHSSDFSEEDFEAVIKAEIRKAEEAAEEFFALEEINRMKRENEERRNDKKQEDASLKVVFKKEPKMTNRERVIEFLKKHGGKATQQDIGYELKIIPQNISTLLGKMEKSGEIDKRNEKGRNIITLLGIKVVQKEEAKPKKRKAGISDKQKKEEILRILKKGKLFQKELEVESGYPQCIISQLIREMEEDGAVSRERKGKKGFVISLKSEN